MKTYPPGTWTTNVRLGRPHEEALKLIVAPEEYRALMLWAGQVDALVLLPDRAALIECTVRMEYWKLIQLLIYRKLFLATERYKRWWGLPIDLIYLTTDIAPIVKEVADDLNIKIVIYVPKWVKAYLETLPLRKRRSPMERMMIEGIKSI